MAFYDGETVKKKIERGPLKLEEALDIASQVAQGLAKAHGRGMVHRDVKPANVLVTTYGVAKLVDFGLARLAGLSAITRKGTTMGTIWYMSSEQARGETADHRSDIWSLGVMVYEMLTGLPPFRGDYENAVVYGILNTEPEPVTALRTGLPADLERIVGKAMAKEPAERYQHVDEMVVDLRHLQKAKVIAPQATSAIAAAVHTRRDRHSPREKPRWKKWVAAAAVASVLTCSEYASIPVY